MNNQRRHGGLATAGRIVVLAGVLSLAAAAPGSAATTDAWLTAKVKVSLLTAEGVSSNMISVDSVNQQITLHGTVNTAEEKRSAESAAKSVQGVKTVRNLLQVVPEKREAKVEAADDKITQQVSAALDRESSLRDSSITVRSVNKGVVLLKGNARNLADHLTAVQIARGVPGVRRVASEVQSEDALADASMWRSQDGTADDVEVARAGDTRVTVKTDDKGVVNKTKDAVDSGVEKTKDAARSTGHAVKGAAESATETVKDTARATTGAASDLYTTSMVKMRLLADQETPALDINVDTNDGVVTLFGDVPTREAKMAAEADAKKVAGLKSVRNELQVAANASAAKQPAVEAKEDEIRTSIEKNLDSRDDLRNVTADVKKCTVRLTGTVPSGVDRVEAMQVARATRGVCSVRDELRISN